jgi:hypothetical protein
MTLPPPDAIDKHTDTDVLKLGEQWFRDERDRYAQSIKAYADLGVGPAMYVYCQMAAELMALCHAIAGAPSSAQKVELAGALRRAFMSQGGGNERQS